jgi:hypothetical protein
MEVYSCTYTNRKPDIRARHICSTRWAQFQGLIGVNLGVQISIRHDL